MEHHLLITVPHYHLAEMHRLLSERGVLGEGVVEPNGYLAVLRRAASKPQTAPAPAATTTDGAAPRIPPF